MTVDQDRLMSTDCADVWAEEFAKIHPEIDRGLMIGWTCCAAGNAKLPPPSTRSEDAEAKK